MITKSIKILFLYENKINQSWNNLKNSIQGKPDSWRKNKFKVWVYQFKVCKRKDSKIINDTFLMPKLLSNFFRRSFSIVEIYHRASRKYHSEAKSLRLRLISLLSLKFLNTILLSRRGFVDCFPNLLS